MSSAAELDDAIAQASDLDAIARTLSGETNAFAELVARYQQRIRGYCLNMLRSPLEAEDAAQEVFLKAFKGLTTFRSDSSFSTWLYRIAVNHCRDCFRKASRQKTTVLEPGIVPEVLQQRATQEASLIDKSLLQVLFRSLKEEYREVLLLREYHQHSYNEIAMIMEASVDSVKARLRRARIELAEKLQEIEAQAKSEEDALSIGHTEVKLEKPYAKQDSNKEESY